MSDVLTIEDFDADGAVRETYEDALERSGGTSRADFFRKVAMGAGGVTIAGVVLPTLAIGKPSATQDVAILNFALTLEYLEAAFYAEANKSGFKGEARKFASTVGHHEAIHVAYLRKALGSKAVAKPKFNFKGTTKSVGPFLQTAYVLENTGVAAYNGQGPNLTKKTLGAAATIVSVEARHAAWVGDIIKKAQAPNAFDTALSKAAILKAVGKTGFITG